MPNQYQVSFLAAFFTSLALLVSLSHYIQSQLKAAGYDVSRLILIGLPTNHTNMDSASASSSAFPLTQIGALLLAAATSALLYAKFGVKSRFILRMYASLC